MNFGVPAYPPPAYATLPAVCHGPHGPAPQVGTALPTQGVMVVTQKQQPQPSWKPPTLKNGSVYEAVIAMKIASVSLCVLCCLCGSPLTLVCFIPAIILSAEVLCLVLCTMPFLCCIANTGL